MVLPEKLDVQLILEAIEPITASSKSLRALREARALNVNPIRPSESII